MHGLPADNLKLPAKGSMKFGSVEIFPVPEGKGSQQQLKYAFPSQLEILLYMSVLPHIMQFRNSPAGNEWTYVTPPKSKAVFPAMVHPVTKMPWLP
jgi:hypothetical protein